MKKALVLISSLAAIGSTSSALAATSFTCTPRGNWPTGIFAVVVDSDQVQVYMNKSDAGTRARGSIDPSYRPSAKYEDFVRFKGLEKLVQISGATVNLLMEKRMLQGRSGEVVITATSDEGGGYSHAMCVTK